MFNLSNINMKKQLLVVYKDELLLNLLRKYVETNDDRDDKIVGTKDQTVRIVFWTEKIWLSQKEAGVINADVKVLFVGRIKGVDELIPVIDKKFEDSGVCYGWAGHQAVVYADAKALREKRDYEEFLCKLSDVALPESLKMPEADTEQQMLAYGVVNLYNNNLEEFMNS